MSKARSFSRRVASGAGLDGGDGGDVDDGLDVAAAREIIHGFGEALEDGTDGFAAAFTAPGTLPCGAARGIL
jgi:hypothetical protein